MGDFEGEGCFAVNFDSLSFDYAFKAVLADFALETAFEGSVFLDLAVRFSSSWDSGFLVTSTFFSIFDTFLSANQSENYLNSLTFDKPLLPLLATS